MKLGRHIFERSLLVVAFIIASAFTLQAQTKYVQGYVMCDDSTGERVAVKDIVVSLKGGFRVGKSDRDGFFSVMVEPDAELHFDEDKKSGEELLYLSKSYKLNGSEQEIVVVLEENVNKIDEVVFVYVRPVAEFEIEEADIEVVGNHFLLKTSFSVPWHSMTTDDRYVVQPTVHDVTLNQIHNLRPVVIDGRNYDLVKGREMLFGQMRDTLEDFIMPIPKESTPMMVLDSSVLRCYYRDSVYIESANLGNDFKAVCYSTSVTYDPPKEGARDIDTVVFGQGTVNPLRFFQYDVLAMQLDGSIVERDQEPYWFPTTGADTTYIPTPVRQTLDTPGSEKIEFEINKTTVNLDNPVNQASVAKIQGQLNEVQNDPFATLKSISMKGYASPDGQLDKNQKLANERTEEVLKLVTSVIRPDVRKRMELTHEGVVERWSTLVPIIDKNDPELSAKVEMIVRKHNDQYQAAGYEIGRMKEYRKVIVPDYLPDLRRLEYNINYSVFRTLTYGEVKAKYGKEKITRYEYYTLIAGESDPDLRAEYSSNAIKNFPDFTIFVNREAARLINTDSVNMEILEPVFEGKDTPLAIRYNQAIMALRSKEMAVADSLAQSIEENEQTRHLHKIIGVLNGDYEGSYEYFKEQGGVNQILILLAMKENRKAFEQMDLLMYDAYGPTPESETNALYNYIYAICLTRDDNLYDAEMCLRKALELDPSLEEIVVIDGDLTGVYAEIAKEKEEQGGGSSNE